MGKKVVATPQPFIVRRSGVQGKGVYATRDIAKAERIAEYVGERISWKEADRRYDDAGMRRHHTFLFGVTTRTVIDGAVNGNDSRFINHSCAPNCEAIDDGGRIFVEALRTVRRGEEIFYDYAYARDESTTDEDESTYRCLCGSAKCRGTILEARKKRKVLPKVHHVAARHPHEQLSKRKSGELNVAAKKRSGAAGKPGTGGRTRVKESGGRTRVKESGGRTAR